MTRRFNQSQRVALFLAADGKCAECGDDLQPGWHGDHVKPFSKGGPTDVVNGQALCANCNLRKGDTDMELRAWQSDALRKLIRSNGDFLTVATPGAGKTTFALTAAQRLIDRGEVLRIIVVVPTAHLRKQWAGAAGKLGIQLDYRFANGVGAIAKDYDGVAVTYATVAAQPQLWRKLTADTATMVILDEVHHAGEDDNLSWGPALKTAFEHAVRRVLLSGTPFRSDGNRIPFVTYDENGRCVAGYNYDYGQALADRTVVRPIEFPAWDGSVRWRDAGTIVSTSLADADDTTLAKALSSALKPDGDWIRSVLERANAELSRHRLDVPDAAGLVVASDQEKARAYAEILTRLTGEPTTLAISDDPEASGHIARFSRGTSRWIVAVQMVSEGVDIPRLVVGVYASRIRTEMFFRQVVGRFVRMRSNTDETYAALFVPSIQPLLSYAAKIEKTVDKVLAEQEEKIRESVKRGEGGQTTLLFDLVEPLNPSEAIHHSTILAGDSFTDDELRRAETLAKAAGMPSSITAAQAARLLRLGGAGRVVGTASAVVSAPETKPLSDEKDEIRRILSKKVGRLHRLTGTPHSHINNQLNQACGDVKIATFEQLNKRLDLVDQWIKQAQS